MELNASTGKPAILPTNFDVKLGRGLLKEAFLEHKRRLNADIKSWKDRLREVAEIKEWNIQPNSEAIELALKVVLHKPRGNERPLDGKLVSWEEAQTSGVDNGSVGRRITSWQKGKLLGNGSYGRVYEILTDDGTFFAVKEVYLLDQGCQSLLYLEQEISLLSQLRHDNIVRYYGTEKMQALFRIGKGELPPIPDSLSRDARDFILSCLRVNPNNRPSAAQLLDHPFVRKPPTSSGLASPHDDNISS
ncbi:hypothetical protein EUGRSUZ_C01392 [Eucalyptus grandis]|uniref:Uncharacterized protein n=2 Tax=Eucalyptus grandis TaxID=71139 RepID=A0ACC3LDN4_EUCGR|nr:hypothetical protein EUGRSUZ_C01392 [Eucalyptus grandis]